VAYLKYKYILYGTYQYTRLYPYRLFWWVSFSNLQDRRVLWPNQHRLDGHIYLNSNRRLPLIVCRPRKKTFYFRFPFTANKQKLPFSVSSVYCMYIYIYIYIYIYSKYSSLCVDSVNAKLIFGFKLGKTNF
jgi:hypothetical protein